MARTCGWTWTLLLHGADTPLSMIALGASCNGVIWTSEARPVAPGADGGEEFDRVEKSAWHVARLSSVRRHPRPFGCTISALSDLGLSVRPFRIAQSCRHPADCQKAGIEAPPIDAPRRPATVSSAIKFRRDFASELLHGEHLRLSAAFLACGFPRPLSAIAVERLWEISVGPDR